MLQRGQGVAEEVKVLRVGAKTNPNALAGAIAGVVREKGACELQTIGAGAVNQAFKAIAIARGFLAPSGIDIIARPSFRPVPNDTGTGEITAIATFLEPTEPGG